MGRSAPMSRTAADPEQDPIPRPEVRDRVESIDLVRGLVMILDGARPRPRLLRQRPETSRPTS